MKKRITGFLMCSLLLCMSLFAGCSLVDTNYKNYYTQTVATVEKDGHRYEISKRELMYAYQTTGYQYVQYYGMSKEEAYKQMLSSLENTKILVDTAEKTFNISRDGTNLSEKEKTYLYSEVEDAFESNFDVFYKDVVGEEKTSQDEDTNSVTFAGYTKNASYNAVTKTITRENKSAKLLSGFTYTYARDINKNEDKELIYTNFLQRLNSQDQKKAFRDYYRNLKANEYGLGLNTDQKDVFMREIDRLYNSVYETYVCAKYNESILDENSTNVTTTKIANLYASKVRAGYTQYVIEQDSNYDSTLNSSLDKMYYFKEGATDNKYFTVANILIKFDDDQQKDYDAYTKEYEDAKDPSLYEDYQSNIEGVYNRLEPVIRIYNNGTKTYDGEKSKTVSVEEVYSDIASRLSKAQATGDVNKVGDEINNLVYEYNEDPGMLKGGNNYVIGVDKDGNLVSNSFVSSFNDGAIELYNKGNAKIGDVSGYVKTSYGIHILIYTGACKNLFEGIDSNFSLSEDALNVLYTTRVNPLIDKTYFDVMYDEIYSDNTTSYQQANLSVLKQDYKIYEYPSRFSDLLK